MQHNINLCLIFDFFWFSNICKVPNCAVVRFGILPFMGWYRWGAAPRNREAIFGDAIAAPSFAWQWSRRLPSAQT